MIPPSPVQSANFDSGAGGSSSLAALFTGAQTAGNSNFIFIYWNSPTATISSVTDTKGNTYTLLYQNRGYTTNNNFACYYCLSIVAAAASANTVTVALSASSTFSVNASVEVTGVTSIDTNAFGFGSGGAASGTITTNNIQELIFSGIQINGAAYTGAANGFTNYVLTASDKFAVDYIKTTAGTYTETPTESAQNGWGFFMVALIGVAGTGSTLPPPTNEVLINGAQVLSGNGVTTGNVASNVLDANDFTFWESTVTTGDWVGQDSGVQCQLTRVRFSPKCGSEDSTLGGLIQGADDSAFSVNLETIMVLFPRPLTGTLMNEYITLPLAKHRYYRYLDQAPLNGSGRVADLDLIAQFTSGISAACATPVISPSVRQCDVPIVVTLSCITTTASIFYTLDGTTPTGSSTPYTGPFVVGPGRIQVQAIATALSLSNSRVVSGIFYVPHSIQSNDIIYDSRNYPITGEGSIFQDPKSGWWYRVSDNYDEPGILVNGSLGNLLHKSADLRNWIYVSTIFTPPGGQAVNYNFYNERAVILYNALNNNYVAWSHTVQGAGNLAVWTSTNVEGPYTLFTTYSTLDGQSGDTSSDFNILIDTDGVTAWLYRGPCSSLHFFISKLTTDYKNTVNGSVVVYPDDSTSPFGQESEGWTVFFNQGFYFVVASGFTTWQPNTNYYVTSTNPQGPWSARQNPFQSMTIPQTPGNIAEGVVPGPSNAYDSQAGSMIRIPGRNAYITTFDRWDNTLPNNTVSSATAPQFANYRKIILPIVFPAPGQMSITWNAAWNLDAVFPTVTGGPKPPNGLQVSGSSLTWNNVETNPVAMYLDFSAKSDFSVAKSEFIAMSANPPTSYTPLLGIQNGYYRIRLVNANGSSFTGYIQNPLPAVSATQNWNSHGIKPSNSKNIQYLQTIKSVTVNTGTASSAQATLTNIVSKDVICVRISWQSSSGSVSSVSGSLNGSYLPVPGALQSYYGQTTAWYYLSSSAAGNDTITATLSGSLPGVVIEATELSPWEVYTATPAGPNNSPIIDPYYPGGPRWNNLNVIQGYIDKFNSQNIYLKLPHP